MDWGYYDQESAIRQRYFDVDERVEHIRDALTDHPGIVRSFQDMYDISWLYHENGLEGIVLTFPEIKSAVDNRVISDVSLLPTYRDIKVQKQCLDTIRDKARSKRFVLQIAFLQELHRNLLGGCGEAGAYRKDIPIHRTYFHEIAPPGKIESQLQQVLDYLRESKDTDLHPLELAGIVHHQFMRVFPFARYSGFLGRLLLNFVLVRAAMFPVVIHATDRQRYYEALRLPERDFRLFLVEVYENALENALRFVDMARKGGGRVATLGAS